VAAFAADDEGCQFPLGPQQLCGRPVVRSGKPGRPSAYCDLPGHTRAKAWAARRAYDSGDEHGQTVAVPAGESVVDRPVSYGRMSFEALLAQFQQVAAGHGEQMAALVDQASQLARTVADPDAAAYEVEEAHRSAEKRVAEADAAQRHPPGRGAARRGGDRRARRERRSDRADPRPGQGSARRRSGDAAGRG